MSLIADLRARNLQNELMDSPELDAGRFVGSLEGLRRVNRVTGSARILQPHLESAARADASRPLRVLDMACGGGDVAITLWRRLRAQGLDVEMHGCDINPLAVEHAAEQAECQGADLRFFQLNAVADPIPPGFDVIMHSLFLHHLSGEDAVASLRKAAQAARRSVLVHDLVRGRAGHLLAYLGVRVLLCNDVCHADGPRSVEGAFTIDEAKALAEAAGLEGCSVEPKFPFRFLLTWSKA
ncbi:MAG: methyltransferase domain-containing protein [Candidatus Hydrogenedentes bacterium]|nr:methyltransferase domain-containing protein [Candidatus Hydrogenedentota bacterium]